MLLLCLLVSLFSHPVIDAINCTNTFHLNEWWVYEWCEHTHVRQVHLSAPKGIILQEYIMPYETTISEDTSVKGMVAYWTLSSMKMPYSLHRNTNVC